MKIRLKDDCLPWKNIYHQKKKERKKYQVSIAFGYFKWILDVDVPKWIERSLI